MSSTTSSSSLASYLPTLLLIPVGYALWKFSSPPLAAASAAGSSSSNSSSSTSTNNGQAAKSGKKKKKPVKSNPADASTARSEQPKAPAPAPALQGKPKPRPAAAAGPAPVEHAPPSMAEVVKKGKKKSNKLKSLAAEDKSKPLAELHAEREAKRLGTSGVEDMLPPVLPPARVMKIASATTYEEPKKATPKAPSPPSSSSSEDDDESDARLTHTEAAPPVHETDDGWEQAPAADDEQWETIPVKNKAKKPLNNPLLSSIGTTSAAATAAAASAASAKKARQNAARAEAKKAAKQDSEAERLRALAAHKKRLEQARIEEIYRKGRGKAIGGGMTASVSSNGKLEWD